MYVKEKQNMNANKTNRKSRSIKPQNVIERDKKIAASNAAQILEMRRNSIEARGLASFIEDYFQKNPEKKTFDFKWDVFSDIKSRMEKKTQNGEKIGNLKTSVIPKNLTGTENMLTVLELTIDLASKVFEKSFPGSVIYWSSDSVKTAGGTSRREIIANYMQLVLHIKRRQPRAYIAPAANARPLSDTDKMLETIAIENYRAFMEREQD